MKGSHNSKKEIKVSSNLKFYIELISNSKFPTKFELHEIVYFKFPLNLKEILANE